MRSFHVCRAVLGLLALGSAAAIGHWSGAGWPPADARMFSCSMHPQVQHAGAGLCPMCRMALVPAEAIAADDGPGVAIDPVVVQNMGVRTARVGRGELAVELRLPGSVQVAQDRLRDITLKFSGFVERLHASRDGMAIAAGDPLFELYSPDLVVAEERLLAGKRSGEAGPLATARQRLERWDVPTARIDEVLASGVVPRTIVWPSPVRGLLVQRSVTPGGRVDAGTTVLRVADLSTVWVDAAVPEAHVASMRVGMPARVELTAQPGLQRQAALTLVAPLIDERTRTGTIRLELENADGALLPGMFACVHVRIVRAASALLIPDAAVLETGTRQLCWVARGDGRFEPRELRLGASGDGGVTEVLDGLQDGDVVVTNGQLLIEADSRLRECVERLAPVATEAPLHAAPEPIALPKAAQQAVDDLFACYLRVAADLAADRDDPDHWRELVTGSERLTGLLPEPDLGRQLAAAVAPATVGLTARREAFVQVSAAAIALFERAQPHDSCGQEIVVVHCSMKPGTWLQTDREVRNPYYGAEMLACGSVVRALSPGGGAR